MMKVNTDAIEPMIYRCLSHLKLSPLTLNASVANASALIKNKK